MVAWKVVLTKDAQKDAKKITAYGVRPKVEKLLSILRENPYEPPYEKLVGDLQGYYSRRINDQHRLVYQIFKDEKVSKLLVCGLFMNELEPKNLLVNLSVTQSLFNTNSHN